MNVSNSKMKSFDEYYEKNMKNTELEYGNDNTSDKTKSNNKFDSDIKHNNRNAGYKGMKGNNYKNSNKNFDNNTK